MKLCLVYLLLVGLVVTLAEPLASQRGVIHEIKRSVGGPNPYIFLTVPRGRSPSIVQGFEVVADDDDEEDEEPDGVKLNNSVSSEEVVDDEDEEEEDTDADNDVADDDNDDEDGRYESNDDDDEEMENNSEEQMGNFDGILKSNGLVKKSQYSQMLVSRKHAGAIMVPDEILEVEGQRVVDQQSGKPAILLPRSILDSIPDGSVVALLEQPLEARSEERANRVIVRRRRKGSRRNVRRRRVNGNSNRRRRRRGGNRRRVGNNNRVRVLRVNGNRRRNVRRGGNRRRVVYQG